MFSLLPIRDWLYLGAIIALITGFLFYRHSLIVDGEQIAQAREVKAAKEQKARDDLVAKGAVSDLNKQIAMLSNVVLTDVPVPMRLCVPARQVSKSGAAAGTSGSPSGPADLRGVSPGVTVGADIGAAVLDLAYAGGIEAAYRNALAKWALEQGK